MFVTQLYSNAGNRVLRNVWVMTNRRFISDMSIKRNVEISERQNVLLAYIAAHADKRNHFVRSSDDTIKSSQTNSHTQWSKTTNTSYIDCVYHLGSDKT